MRVVRTAVIAAAMLACAATSARADGFISPFVGFNFGGDSANCASLSNCDEKRTNWGVSIGAASGIFGFEEDLGYAPSFFGTASGGDSAVLTLMSNLMLIVPAGPVRPYAVIGLGLIRPHVKFSASSLSLEQNSLGYDVGGGVNIFFGHTVGVRGDIRHMHTLQDVTLGVFGTDKLNFLRESAGLTFRF